MRRYPEYKESGVAWIGEIPVHFEMKRLKYVADLNMGQSPPSEEYNSDSLGTPFLQGNADFGPHHPTPKIYCPTARKHAIPGDILLSVRAPVGAINIADQEYGIGRGLCAIRPRMNQLECRYAKYLLEVVRTELYVVATGTTYDAVTVDYVSNITCVVPPFSEQTQIANFLDRKTEQTDELIRIKEQRIELLQEQRTALINQTVTKGLYPNAEMKPSGMEWIGEIPKDRKATRLKYICELIVDCEHKTAPTQETGYPLIRTPNIGIGHLILDDVNRVSEKTYQEWSRRVIPQSGDLILAREAPIGNVAIIPTDLKVCLGQRTVLIRPDKNKVYAMFLVYLMLGDETQVKLLGHSTGAIVHHLNMTDIRNLELPRLPSLPIQRKIANFLDHKIKQIDELISVEQGKIELLKEYRQSLIFEVITGKIDVRSEV